MKAPAAPAVLFAAVSAAGAALPAAAFQTPGVAGAPYNSAPAAAGPITVKLDLEAARAILALLSAAQFDAEGARALEVLPAVQAAIRDSKRPAEVFEHDLAAAFDEKARVTVFDFRRIRDDRGRWKDLLTMIAERETELTRLASDRARALLPADRPVAVTQAIFLTFGVAGRADHFVFPTPDGPSVVADLSRYLSDVQGSSAAEQVKHLSRLMAAEAFQRAWSEYRAGSPAWQKRDTALGGLEPLLRRVAEAGPVSIYHVDENFFPLAVWLKQPMKDDLDELNRVAERLVAAGGDLDARMAVAAEIQKPEFTVNVAGPAGAFLVDGVVQTLGIDAGRAALAGGPRAFFQAYDRASQKKGSGLVPLSRPIREQLAAAAAPPKG